MWYAKRELMWPVMSVVITRVFRQQRSQMFMILELAKWNISITNYSRQVSGRNMIVSRKRRPYFVFHPFAQQAT